MSKEGQAFDDSIMKPNWWHIWDEKDGAPIEDIGSFQLPKKFYGKK